MSGCTVTYNGDEAKLPYFVVVKGGEADMRLFLREEGTGIYDLIAYQVSVGDDRHEYRYRFRFSDADTAFWFRIKFG